MTKQDEDFLSSLEEPRPDEAGGWWNEQCRREDRKFERAPAPRG